MPDEHELRDVDSGEVCIGGGDGRVELSEGDGRACVAGAFARTVEMRRVQLDDGDLEAGEAQWCRMDAREAELEHALGRFPEQLDDPRRRRGGLRRW